MVTIIERGIIKNRQRKIKENRKVKGASSYGGVQAARKYRQEDRMETGQEAGTEEGMGFRP